MQPTKALKKILTAEQLLTTTVLDQGAQGMDVDFMFLTERGWVVVEFLRSSTYMSAANSKVEYYWPQNRRKFQALWRLADALEGHLYLVHYETDDGSGDDRSRRIVGCPKCCGEILPGRFGRFRIVAADMASRPGRDPGSLRDDGGREMSFAGFADWLRRINASAGRVPLDE